MRAWVALRWTGAVWFLPILFAVGVYSSLSELELLTGYSVADLALMSYLVGLVGPLTAAYCAFRFNGFISAIDSLAPARSGLRVVLSAWWPLIIGPPVAAILALVVLTRALWPQDLESWQIVGLVAGTVLCCALFGMALGRSLHVAFAVPLAAALSFWWLAFPQAGTNLTIRYLNSGFPVCCTSAQVPSPLMMRASAVFVALVSLGVIFTWLIPGWSKRSRSFVLGSLFAIVGIALVSGITVIERSHERPTLAAVTARITPKSCATARAVAICVWPENAPRASAVSNRVVSLNDRLDRLGLPLVTRVEEDPPDTASVTVVASAHLTEGDISYSLADGYTRWLGGCAKAVDRQEPQPSIVAFIGRLAGMPDSELRHRIDDAAVTSSAQAAELPPEQARAWIMTELGTARLVCGA
ncbi:hypothetical protein [Mumia zhuanghuii]|uniref:DUF7224 domain-containing protein n=1 Tax=Mumia zhuanghuii TaxID=2585211 RepID=A0A5C4LYR7_9ACTN|nr:hypothetical protein [Mumia zhuanghuii]TNC23462.1 hypothetical protein FHE65_35565 [Mumia zhuanghuii]TNC23485.1 hypothetical protein FHE65_35540 [Mumia zhuanghuii]